MSPLRSVTVPGISITKWLAIAIGGPRRLARGIAFATLSVAETLLGLVGAEPVEDIRRWKEAYLQECEAKAACRRADAQRKLTEAADAADAAKRDSLLRWSQLVQEADERRAQARAAKLEAEVDAIRSRIETDRIKVIAHAKAELLEAHASLRAEGGQSLVHPENLESILRTELPQPEADDKDRGECVDDPQARRRSIICVFLWS